MPRQQLLVLIFPKSRTVFSFGGVLWPENSIFVTVRLPGYLGKVDQPYTITRFHGS